VDLLTRARLNRRRESGASAVEFALILPILMTLVFGIITFGFLLAQDLALGNSSRQAARYGVVRGHSCSAIIAQARRSSEPLVGLDGDDVHVALGRQFGTADSSVCEDPSVEPCDDSDRDDNLYVTVDFEAELLVPVIPGVGSTMDLRGQGVFRCEYS